MRAVESGEQDVPPQEEAAIMASMSDGFLKAGPVRIPLSEISFSFARSGGPGGQNVNKVETKVTVRFRPAGSEALTPEQALRIEERLASRLTKVGEIIVTSERTRYQERNRQDALARLAALLTEALREPKPRRRTRPTAASRERRIEEKKRRSASKRLRRPPSEE